MAFVVLGTFWLVLRGLLVGFCGVGNILFVFYSVGNILVAFCRVGKFLVSFDWLVSMISGL